MALVERLKPSNWRKSKKVTPQDIRLINLGAALFFLLQAVLILTLANPTSSSKPITTSFLAQDKLASAAAGHSVAAPASHLLFDINLAWLVAAFLLVGAIVHLLVATRYKVGYEVDMGNRTNKARWIDFSASFALMMAVVAILSGVFDFSSLIMIMTLTGAMGVMSLMTERYQSQTKSAKWLPYIEGLKFGLVPWLVILIYVWGAHAYGNAIPTFVYWIYLSLFVLFAAMAANLFLQVKKIGHWENYFFTERAFILLIIAAKTALAWQVFFGTLR